MNSLSKVFGFSTSITTSAYYLILWIQLLTSIAKIRNEVLKRFGLAYGILLCLGIVSILLHPASKQYVIGTDLNNIIIFQPQTIFASGLFIFVGLLINDFWTLRKVLHATARAGMIMGAVVYIFSILNGTLLHYDDMNYAYAMSTMICILVADYQSNDLWFIIIGFICLIIAGTRGPIVCCLSSVFIKSLMVNHSMKRIVARITLVSILIALLYSNLFSLLLLQISGILAKFGITQLRLLEYSNSGMLLDSSGRDGFAEIVMNGIWKQPIIGYGIGGDRILLGGRYCHNFILELFVSFGIIVGLAILGIVVIMGWKMVISKDDYIKSIGIALICSSVLKLMFSSSFIFSKELFIFIGLAINAALVKDETRYGGGTYD